MTATSVQEQADRIPLAIMPLLRALGDLKRIRSAGRTGSIAERLFAKSWSRLVAGEDAIALTLSIVSEALIATRLGDLDVQVLGKAGIPDHEITRIRRTALEMATEPLDSSWRMRLLDAALVQETKGLAPPFVARLAAQPRAGATCPGRGRLMLEPSENHAEHCALVAIYGTLLAQVWDARSQDVFLAGLAHHLHNALLPDAGYAGEVLLGDWLQSATANAAGLALRELPVVVRSQVEAAGGILANADSPEGCAFHAADTLDRVLQLEHHLRAANTTMDFVLREMELVHAGPVKPYQDAVLARLGLAA